MNELKNNNIKYISNKMDFKLKKHYDQSSNKPKKIYNKNGSFNTAFLKWNRKEIKLGNIDIYADKNYLVNGKTGRLIKKVFQKPRKQPNKIYKKNGLFTKAYLKWFVETNEPNKPLAKSFLKKYPNIIGSVIKDLKGELEKVYNPQLYNDDLYEGEYINNSKFLYKSLTKINAKPTEMYTVIVKAYDQNNKISVLKDEVITIPEPFTLKTYNSNLLNMVLLYDSDFPNIIAYLLSENITVRFIITKLIDLDKKDIIQRFAEGNNHCLITPIVEWANTVYNNTQIKSTKKKYLSIINKLNGKELKTSCKKGYLEIYKDGIPQDEIQDFCEDLQIQINLEFPFKKNKYLNFSSTKKPLKKFNYINTRLNHVDYKITTTSYSDLLSIDYTEKELNEQMKELIDNNVYFVFYRNSRGISQIETLNNIYKVKDDYSETTFNFMKDNNFDKFKIDALKEKDLTTFINNGTHFNGTTDFKVLPDIFTEDLEHIDMKKAYTQYTKCKYYNGFVGAITDLRLVDNYKQKGLYYIEDLDLTNANSKFKFYNEKMKWFLDKNIYTDAELRFLKDMGTNFNVKCGAYGIKADFRFTDEMINKKEHIKTVNGVDIKISYYAKFVGKLASINYDKRINMKGSAEYFQTLVDGHNKIKYDVKRKEATIIYPKKNVYHHKHISAQITAYQRLLVMEQLLKMDNTKIIRVCVDGIYYYNHKCNINYNVFQDKKDSMTFNNSPTETYLSNIFENITYKNKKSRIKDTQYKKEIYNKFTYNEETEEVEENISYIKLVAKTNCNNLTSPLSGIKFGMKRQFYLNELWLGEGGTGKSFMNLTDYGHVKCLFLAPSWKLARNVEAKLMYKEGDDYKFTYNPNIDVNVDFRYLNMEYSEQLQTKYNVVIHDECSQKTEFEKQKIMKISNTKHIFLGDIGYQLEPVIDYNGLKKLHCKILDKESKEIEKRKEQEKIIPLVLIKQNKYYKEIKKTEPNFIKWLNEYGHYEIKIDGFDNILTLTKDYRATCNKLIEIKKTLRDFIDKGRYKKKDEKLKIRQEAIDYIKSKIPKISDDDLIKNYNVKDMILASKHEIIKKYNNMFSHLEKYLVSSNSKNFSNGEIIYNKVEGVSVKKYKDEETDKTHAYTVHAIQGETLDTDSKLYINTEDMFSDRMLYTAISRARRLDQIYLI